MALSFEPAQYIVATIADPWSPLPQLSKPQLTADKNQTHETLVGFGRFLYFTKPENAEADCIPDGWYLLGLCVDPQFRRCGIGNELTRRRCIAIAKLATTVRYFANSTNKTSIALHQKLGFIEERRPISHPQVTFSGGGVGVLFSLDLSKTLNVDVFEPMK